MNQIQKEKIRYWRGEGLGYKATATKAGVTESAVKGFCRRNGIDSGYEQNACRQCGEALVQTQGRRKKFCSDSCRNTWWNHHAYLRENRAENQRICAHCGEAFYSESGKARKYCCHPCYIVVRFGKEMSRYEK